MSDNIRPALYNADYSCALASRLVRAHRPSDPRLGKHCESGDIVINDGTCPPT